MNAEIKRLEEALAKTEAMWRDERNARVQILHRLDYVSNCRSCPALKRWFCWFFMCPAVEARMEVP